MESRARVYLTQPIPERPLGRLRDIAEVTYNPDPLHIVSADELAAGLSAADVLFCLLHDRVDAPLLARSPRLRLIASMAIIPANIDVAAATARRIPVTVIPPLVTEATADVTMALLLAAARRVVEGLRIGRWRRCCRRGRRRCDRRCRVQQRLRRQPGRAQHHRERSREHAERCQQRDARARWAG